MRFLICLLSCATFLFLFEQVQYAQAEDSARGRLPDGRAFRTDVDGTQLVDYIAELEQGIEDLNRKAISLEDENISLKVQIERLKAGRSEDISEKTLIGNPGVPEAKMSDSSVILQNAEPPNDAISQLPSCPAVPTDFTNCNEQLAANAQKILALQSEVEQQKAEAKQNLARLQQATLEQDRIASSKGATEVQLRAQMKAQEQELVQARLARDRLISEVQQSTLRAATTKATIADDARARLNTGLEDSRHKAVDSIKVRMQQDLNAVLSRKDERDILFAKYIKERQGVTLSPSSLQARSGRNLQQLAEALKKADTVRELSLLRIDLQEISKQMADDLALIERMSKLSP